MDFLLAWGEGGKEQLRIYSILRMCKVCPRTHVRGYFVEFFYPRWKTFGTHRSSIPNGYTFAGVISKVRVYI